ASMTTSRVSRMSPPGQSTSERFTVTNSTGLCPLGSCLPPLRGHRHVRGSAGFGRSRASVTPPASKRNGSSVRERTLTRLDHQLNCADTPYVRGGSRYALPFTPGVPDAPVITASFVKFLTYAVSRYRSSCGA